MSGSIQVELQSEFQGSLAQLLYNTNTESLQKKTHEIITILGGLNNILQIYIANKHELLTKTQQDQLIHILSSYNQQATTFPIQPSHHSNNPSANLSSHNHTADISRNMETSVVSASIIIDPNQGITSQEQQLQQFDIFLHTRDDLYHKIFKNAIADRITEFALSKWMLLVIFVLVACTTIPSKVSIWRFILLILMSIFLISQLFAINLPMTRSILFTFDLGYKMFSCIVIYICSVSLLKDHLQQSNNTNQYDVVDLHFVNTLNIGTVFLMTNHDAWRMPNILKVIVVFGIIGMYIYFWCIAFYEYDFILKVEFQDVLWNVPVLGRYLSLRGLFISSLSNLIIFFAKQEWNMIRNKNKSKIYAVKPNIKWIVDWQQYGNEYYSIKDEIVIK